MEGRFRAFFALVLALSVGLVMAPLDEVGADYQEFNTSTNWTVPPGVSQITVEAWGGGGAGGGSNNITDCEGSGGAGGGGGAYASSTLSVTPGQTLQVAVGAGGTGVTGGNGIAGGPSFVGPDTDPAHADVRAAGGSGGMASTAVNETPTGGAGGTTAASVGSTLYAGTDGGPGGQGAMVWSGAGGNCTGPGGGSGGLGIDGAENSDGNPGNAPGGGGGGGRTSGTEGAPRPGGAGAAGKVGITWAPSVLYYLTMAVAPPGSGTATDLTGASPYAAGTVVNISAAAAAGYQFVGWTAPAGIFGNANAPVTNFTMPAADVTVTANFMLIITPPVIPPCPDCSAYGLIISSTEGGSVTTPGEGLFPCFPGERVRLVASPDAGHKFLYWSGDVATIADVHDASTSITMEGWYRITANFNPGGTPPVEPPVVQYDLTTSSTAGGSVTTPGEGTFNYVEGNVVSLVASPATGYKFVNWTGNVTTIANVNAATTAITMNGDYSITANFEEISGYDLTISSTTGGSVTTPGEGTFTYDEGEVVNLVASPATGYKFVNWTGNVATIANVNAATTAITMNGDYSIKANFEEINTANPANPGGEPLVYTGCFIATAAYGTPTAEQIDVLREFRDAVLLESTAGSQFVVLYYRLSPPVADFIARSDFLRTLVRELLVDPVVWTVEATGAIWRN